MSELRVPVLIDRNGYDAYREFSEEMGVPTSHHIREALEKFLPVLRARLLVLRDAKKSEGGKR